MLEFKENLKGEFVEITGFNLQEKEEIISKECYLEWSLDPRCSTNGVSLWLSYITKFRVTLIIKNEETEEERKVEFDEGSDEYEIEINKDDYKMSSDFTISSIEIDRKLKTVNAFIK